MKMNLLQYIVVSIAFCLLILSSESVHGQNYKQVTEVPVYKDGDQLKSAWAGGLNAPQICMADLNDDGREDIYMFDRDGKRNYTFINTSTGEYIYKPLYAETFPDVNSWVLLEDYNCDGIADLITHGLAAPKTYIGFYQDGQLNFKPGTERVSYKGTSGNPINLYTVSTHRPIMKDINGDGDKDILTFDVGLSRLYFYENLRIDENLPCDSLYFKRRDRCWGNFKETGGITLDLILEDTCDFKFAREIPAVPDIVLHPGGTVIDLYDKENNGTFDLILGDATFERLNYVSNNNPDDAFANFYAQDDSFPSYNTSVDMTIFPAPYMHDIDNDGDEDLLVAPFTTGAIENYQNIWYYKNNGNTNEPFELVQKDFLVSEMIDVGEYSSPTFFDENNDGLLDLVIGNEGYFTEDDDYLISLTLFRNTGTATKPAFTFVDNNFLNLDDLMLDDLTPYFADLDGDNDKDLICGELKGRILYMANNNGGFENPRLLKDANNVEIDVGQFSDPLVYDYNDDGLNDLIIGSRDGNVYYYENTGVSNNFDFTFRTDSLGGVTSRENQALGYSSPAIGDFDSDGKIDLLLSGFNKGVKFYSDIGRDYTAEFTLTDDNFLRETNYNEASLQGLEPRLKIAQADLTNDGRPEILAGINNGGVLFYSEDESIQDTTVLNTPQFNYSDQINIYPNPSHSTITIEWPDAFDSYQPKEILIFNVMGKLVDEIYLMDDAKQNQLDIGDLQTGLYLFQIIQGDKMGTKKVVKY